MPGPTTGVLNEDVRGLRGDLREIRGHLDSFKSEMLADIRRIELGLSRVQTEFSFAKWLLGLLLVATVSGIASGIWWAATLNANVKNLDMTTNEHFGRLDASMKNREASQKNLEASVKSLEGSTNVRFDRLETAAKNLEASIAKVLEQTKPKP